MKAQGGEARSPLENFQNSVRMRRLPSVERNGRCTLISNPRPDGRGFFVALGPSWTTVTWVGDRGG
ncbi:hypothetical protein [Leptolyngbya iicbica]|uniref:Uncharacterized protein n=2 Tax=Cyanophyceae TaxID=3028117 RepID=A0A4Q7EFD6_9CYAN|nr:hypothetical protein [Leptolyngbya sp. LK]RZM81995.1 hypothetical protein DYY88_01630 [Leptolyngbya sp. LK]